MALINLQVGIDKPGNVYRLIHAMEAMPSSHGNGVHYLMIYATVRWSNENQEHDVFCIAMQYSDALGEMVNVSQPAHIALEDIDVLQQRFSVFVRTHS